MTDVERLLADTLADEAWALPVPAGSVPRLQQAVRRRQHRNRLVAGAAAVLLLAGGVAGSIVASDDGLLTREVPAPVAASPVGAPAVVRGVVVDPEGRPADRIAVLPSDASRVLTRTARDGSFEVACTGSLLLAPYAPAAPGGAVAERSPGAGNRAWQRLVEVACGSVVRVTMLAGGAVEGRAATVDEVRLVRLPGASRVAGPGSLVFATRVGADGTWRVEGLDTGRYLVEHTGQLVDVGAGRTVTLP